MSLTFIEVDRLDSGTGCYRAIRPDPGTEWNRVLAEEYVKLRTECSVDVDEEVLEGIGAFDTTEIRSILAGRTVPELRSNEVPNLTVVRSDYGELLGYIALEMLFDTKFGYKSISGRELIYRPGRGFDGVGLEFGDNDRLVLVEVKVSDDGASPPGVVDRGTDSLRAQHLHHLGNDDQQRATKQKLWDHIRKVTDRDLFIRLTRIVMQLEKDGWATTQPVICCILVRPGSLYTHSDFGSFRTAPNDFLPGSVRFIVICVPERIQRAVSTWDEAISNISPRGEAWIP